LSAQYASSGFSVIEDFMRKVCYTFCVVILSAVSTSLSAQHQHHGADGRDASNGVERLGEIHLPISCAASVQVPFERGIALIHSFWYEEAKKQFQAVAVSDPHCAMAQWALAMTEWRPFWDGLTDDRRRSGRVEVDRATALNAKTDRERRYIAALSGYLHAEAAQNDKALQAYDDAMSALHSAYPDDVEAAAFYGLGLAASIGVRDPIGDARKALAVLEPGFEAHPDHPGFAHYIIHTCDTPQLARLALPAAERYAYIAPSSAHALHMPSHIFARLGMWQEDIDSNTASIHASELAEKKHLTGTSHQAHAYEFLLYAYLQQADDANAKRVLDYIGPLVTHLRTVPGIENDGMMPYVSYFEVEFPAIYYLERRDWKRVLSIAAPPGSLVSTKYYCFWAQAIAAGHLRDATTADAVTAAASQLANATAKEGTPIGIEIAAAQGTIKAWQSFAHHEDEEALKEIAAAADVQDRTGQSEVDIPVREMYADMLLMDNRLTDGLAQYRTVLQLSPNRLNALYNAGHTAEVLGREEEAVTDYKQLLTITDNGVKTQLPELTHAQNFVSSMQAGEHRQQGTAK
jgi:tetratricopeptide (TPR) repeat protein